MRYFSNQIAKITDHVYLSSVGGVTQERSLQENGITHILNVSQELQDLTYPLEYLKVTRVSLRDTVEENILPHLDYLVDHVHAIAEQGGNIAVHCIAGVSRSATVCICYLVKHQQMTLKDAYRKVYKAREIIRPNRSFWESMVEFEEGCRGSRTVELLPHVCGVEPSVYKRDIELRIRCGWMNELMFIWSIHLGMVALQAYFG